MRTEQPWVVSSQTTHEVHCEEVNPAGRGLMLRFGGETLYHLLEPG